MGCSSEDFIAVHDNVLSVQEPRGQCGEDPEVEDIREITVNDFGLVFVDGVL